MIVQHLVVCVNGGKGEQQDVENRWKSGKGLKARFPAQKLFHSTGRRGRRKEKLSKKFF
jgi:hypothetical protein